MRNALPEDLKTSADSVSLESGNVYFSHTDAAGKDERRSKHDKHDDDDDEKGHDEKTT